MQGPPVIARSLSWPTDPDGYGNMWQYHSRKDRHAKVMSWALLLDLITSSERMRADLDNRRIGLAFGASLSSPVTRIAKKLDFAISAITEPNFLQRKFSLDGLALQWAIRLTDEQRAIVPHLPTIPYAPPEQVVVALEMKACMTAHGKAGPRLVDELNASHTVIHGHSPKAMAAGLVLINASESFISSDRNRHDLSVIRPVKSQDRQPESTQRTLERVCQLPVRDGVGGVGYDAVGVLLIHMRNDGGRVRTVGDDETVGVPGEFRYARLVRRIIDQYEKRSS